MQKTELIQEDEKLIEELEQRLGCITKKELKYIFKKLKEKDIDVDKIDWYAMGNGDTNYDLIVGFIFQEYGIEIPYPETKTQNETQKQTQNIFNSDMGFWIEVIKEVKSIAIMGDVGTGKTSLAHRILGLVRKYRNMPIYVYNYPRDKLHLIKKLAWNNMNSLEELKDLRNVCLYIDEPQETMRFYSNNGNPALARLLALARQRNILLILSTAISQFVTRMLESQVDVFCVKDCSVDTIKQGGRVSKIIKRYCEFDPDGFKLKFNEYLFYCRKFNEQFKGKFTFELPKYWNEEYSKPYY